MTEVYLPAESQKRLLEIARMTLCRFVCHQPLDIESPDDLYLTSDDYGAFVSLFKGEELRGCVGTCTPHHPLYETVIDMTQAAASRDSRMAPIGAQELGEIQLDITVISRLVKAEAPLKLVVGKHGLHVASGRSRGVLLPQVASERGWDMETFLAQTCVKAGLKREAWLSPDTEVSSFTALIIEEHV
ncbi:MAG: AmmeMemoRadiSam system protein A [Deltaproteobacteria bacterium]|nr:AmmeMemoRadiSam system protein A [Deltaproteobacteria bacterium]